MSIFSEATRCLGKMCGFVSKTILGVWVRCMGSLTKRVKVHASRRHRNLGKRIVHLERRPSKPTADIATIGPGFEENLQMPYVKAMRVGETMRNSFQSTVGPPRSAC